MTIQKITVQNVELDLYRVGIGSMAYVYYNLEAKQAIGTPKQFGRSPTSVLMEAIFAEDWGKGPDYKLIEVADSEKWKSLMRRFRQ